MECSIAAFSCAALAITWEEVVDTASRDEEYQRLVRAVQASFPAWSRNDDATAQFFGERRSPQLSKMKNSAQPIQKMRPR